MSDSERSWAEFLEELAAPESPAAQQKTKVVFLAGFSCSARLYGSRKDAESALREFEQAVRDLDRTLPNEAGAPLVM